MEGVKDVHHLHPGGIFGGCGGIQVPGHKCGWYSGAFPQHYPQEVSPETVSAQEVGK